jgi:FAD/FMN-containing dehydrogenase
MTGRTGWGALRRAISSELALPGSAAYQDARAPFIAGLGEPRPQAVVRCHGPEDVAEVIAFAREHGIGIAVRSGGHSFAGYSSTSGIVIDLTPQCSVVLTGGVAEVGAGARLGELYDALLPTAWPSRPVPAPRSGSAASPSAAATEYWGACTA